MLNVLRIPPQNAQAEQALLGALLANNRAFEYVADFLRPQHFADPVHAVVYEAIFRRVNAGQIADPVTLHNELANSIVLAEVGGVEYLAKLLGAMVGIINAGDYGRAVHDAWLRREVIGVCEAAVNRAFTPTGVTGQDVLEELDGALTRIAEGAGDVRPPVSASEAVSAAVAGSIAASEREGTLAGITTGFASLDRMTSGLLNGEVYVIGARPGMGKSGLSLGIAARAASAGVPTLLWSGEMSAMQMGTRLAASYAGLDIQSVFRGKGWRLPDDAHAEQGRVLARLEMRDFDRLVKAQRAAGRLPLIFDDRPGLTVAGLRARARKLKRAGKLRLMVVDYVGLLRASQPMLGRSLYEQTTELSRDLKLLAGEMDVPLVLCAQLNRGNERRENKTPQLSDLRDSGALEQDAYCVMFIHRPHYYLMQEGEPARTAKDTTESYAERVDVYHALLNQSNGKAIVNIAKNRGGPTGTARLQFNGPEIWFRDEAEDGQSPAWGDDFMGGL